MRRIVRGEVEAGGTRRSGGRARAAVLGFFALAAAGAAGPPRAALAACCAPFEVARHEWPCRYPDCVRPSWIAADSLGGVYILEESGGTLGLRVSRDDGDTWETVPLPVSTLAYPYAPPAAAVSAEGDVLVAYAVGSGTYSVVSHDQGRTFAPAVLLGDTPGEGAYAIVAAFGPDGTAAVAWTPSPTPGPAGDSIRAAVSGNRGDRFGPMRRVNDPPGAPMPPRLVVSGGTVVLAWEDADGIRADRTDDGGWTWGADRRVVSTAHLTAAATTFDGRFQTLFCVGQPSCDLFASASADDARTWGVPEPLAAATPAMGADLLGTAGGGVHAAWVSASPAGPILANGSGDGGLAGTWRAVPADAGIAFRADWVRLAAGPGGSILLAEADYRDEGPTCRVCESVYLDRSCDAGATWLAQKTRADRDAPPELQHSEDPVMAVSRAGRIHVLWLDGEAALQNPIMVHAAFEVEPAAWAVVVTPATPCTRGEMRLEVGGGGSAACASPAYQWYRDGAPIPGASAATYDVPAGLPAGTYVFHCTVECVPALPCGGVSAPVVVEIPSIPTDVVDFDLAGLLRVRRDGGLLTLTWTEGRPEPRGYNLYAGTIRSLHDDRRYDHAALECAVARSPADAVRTETTVPIPPSNTYYLVAPAGCLGEGGVGTNSAGVPRPLAGSGAPCGAVP